MSEAISYKIYLDRINQHLLLVECTIQKPNPEGQVVSLPAWVPGSYMIRDFGKYLVDIVAESKGQQVAIGKIAKNTWRCEPCNGELVIRYLVYGFDLMPRGAYIDNTRAFFDGCRIFLVVEGEEEQTRSVEIVRPRQESCHHWRCMTSMTPQKLDEQGFGSYVANNHLELIDHPFEISNFQKFEFKVANVPHILVVDGRVQGDFMRLLNDMQKICTQHVNFFGELPPMPKYVFIMNVIGKGYGGIEHRSSCTLLCSRSDLPVVGSKTMSEEYRSLLGLISHEYFHLWNVKRIKPEVFVNYDLTAEVYTRQLWIFEGITAYYDNLALIQSNVITPAMYLKILQKDITTVLQSPGSGIQTLEDSSFDAWIKYYQPDENSPNATISYYVKGSLVALALDLLIIKNTKRKQSLVDVMQVLWQQYGKPGIGLPERHFERVVYEVTGEDYSDFFDLALRTTEPLPLPELLLEMGVIYKTVAADFLDALGVKFVNDQARATVKTVLNNTVAEYAGLAPNDIIVAVNHVAVSLNNIEIALKRFLPGDHVKLQIFRNDYLLDLKLTIPEQVKNVCELEIANNLTSTQQANWHKWLGDAEAITLSIVE
jgi:predicted metalloprotease with PDZ domain